MSLTRQRNLRDGRTVWAIHRKAVIRSTPLHRSTHAEVVVIGAGITGAMIAQSLAEAGLRPLILERRRCAILGSTAASTALLQYELDTPMLLMRRTTGVRRTDRIWTASHEAVNELRTRTLQLGIKAELQSRPSLYLAGTTLDAKGLQHEAKLRQRIGLPCEYLGRKQLKHHFGIDRDAAVLSHGNAEANPVQLAAGFLRRALQQGARLHSPHDVVDIQRGRGHTTLFTAEGLEIRTRHVVLCTGYELAKIVPDTGSKILSTWVIATQPQAEALWPQQALLWEASDPYLYLRTTSDGRVICGGEDEDFADAERRDAMLPQKSKRLASRLRQLFPQLDPRPEFAWSGTFGGSRNGLPTIGSIPGYPRCHAVMGYGGNGITFSMLATKIITAAIRGRKAAEAPLFGFC
jgi:glycine/D-amino acid oxidase-like deaminating enzyme